MARRRLMARSGKLLKFWTQVLMLLVAFAAALGALGLKTKTEITVYLKPGDLLRSDLDANAHKLLPLKIEIPIFFNVTAMKEDLLVEGGFTGQALVDNYPLGKYLLSETEEPNAVISAVKESVEQYLSLHPGSKAKLVAATGCADGATVLPGALYTGDLRSFQDFSFYSEDHGRFEKMTLIAGETRLDNTAIAFLRAYDALREFSTLACLRDAKEQVRVETSPLRGGEYRRVFIRFTIQGALKDEYERLSLPAKIRLSFQREKQVPGLYLTE
jgi:hypothetical protein